MGTLGRGLQCASLAVHRMRGGGRRVSRLAEPGRPGTAPPERWRQEAALFAFFSNGLSALECLGFGLYFVAAIVAPAEFARPPHRVWFSDVANAYQESFEGDSIAGELVRVNESPGLGKWKVARNILMHREAPGRHHYIGGEKSGADWLEEPLSEATTSDRRAWLGETLTALLDQANDFATERL